MTKRKSYTPISDWLTEGGKPDAAGYVYVRPERWAALRRALEEVEREKGNTPPLDNG